MARFLSHSWADRKPFTRRARFYCESREWNEQFKCYVYTGIRVAYTDQEGEVSLTYDDDSSARADWEAFKSGALTTTILREKRNATPGPRTVR